VDALKQQGASEYGGVYRAELYSQPIVFTPDMKVGQLLAVSYDNIRERRKGTDS
jgi:hypothetical protein